MTLVKLRRFQAIEPALVTLSVPQRSEVPGLTTEVLRLLEKELAKKLFSPLSEGCFYAPIVCARFSAHLFPPRRLENETPSVSVSAWDRSQSGQSARVAVGRNRMMSFPRRRAKKVARTAQRQV